MRQFRPVHALLGAMVIMLIVGTVGCERPVPDQPTPTLEVVISPQAPPTQERQPTTVSVLETPAAAGTATATIFWDVPSFTPTPEGPVSPTPTPPPQAVQPTWTPTADTAPTQPTAPQTVSHTVGWGDTLYGLAGRYDTTVDAIVRLNNLPNENFIRVGQVLQIPRGDQAISDPAPGGTITHTIQRGDTLYGLAARYNTTVQAIAELNGIMNPAFIRVGQQIRIPTGTRADVPDSTGTVYVVQRGDTLTSIAARYGTTAWAIAYANNIPNENWIRVGQTLIIPAP